MTATEPTSARRVFLSYAYDDHDLAQQIRAALARSGVGTTDQVWDLSPGENLAARLRDMIRASDVVVLVLTPTAASSQWVGAEVESALSQDLDRRGADLIPVLAAPMDLPPTLGDRAVVDLTADMNAGLQQLVEQVHATSKADFSAMSPRAFEDLVADLLRAAGFGVDDLRHRPDQGVDLRATYQRTDPFGSPETEAWLVQVKLYSHSRVSVDAIRALAGALAVASGYSRGLLVTNTQLTSVALEYVADLNRTTNLRLQVLDGVGLKRLLRQFPAVAERHFGGEAGKPELGSGGDT